MKLFSWIPQSIFIVALSILFSLLIIFPAIPKLASIYIGDGWDNYEYASYQMLAAKEITNFKYPFVHQEEWRYPVGFDFSRGFDSYLTVVTGALLSIIVGMPLAYNLTVLILMILNGVLSFIFFNAISKNKLLGIFGMVAFGFSFYVIGKAASHPNLLFIGGFPLFAYSILNLLRVNSIRKRDFALVFASILLTALGSLQYLLLLLIGSSIAIIAALIADKSIVFRFINKIYTFKDRAKGVALIFLALFIVLYFPYLWAMATGAFVFLDRSRFLSILSPNITDYILPNVYLKLLISKLVTSTSPYSIEKVVFLGFIEIALFIGFVISSRGRLKLFLGGLFLFFFVLSLGAPSSSLLYPYNFLVKVFPFSSIIETGRFAVLFYFFLITSAVCFLTRFKNNTLLITFIILLCLFERLPSSTYMASILKNDQFINTVKGSDTTAVLDIPVNLYYSRYNLYSIYYQKPIVNGYFHWSADTNIRKSFIVEALLDRYTCDEQGKLSNKAFDPYLESVNNAKMISGLKRQGVKTIVVHKDDKFYHPVCTNVRKQIGNLTPFTESAETTNQGPQKQISGQALDGYSRFNIYLPYNGMFYIDGVFIDPSEESDFSITVDGQPLEIEYSWTPTQRKNAVELTPKNMISLNVSAGSTLSFVSKKDIHDSALSIWYRYEQTDSSYAPLHSPISKVFEDKMAIIYQIN